MLTAANRDFQAGQYDRAEIEYLKLIKLEPKQALPWVRLGTMYQQEGRSLRAYVALKRAATLDPTNRDVVLRLASLEATGGEREVARKAVEQVLAHDPTNNRALVLLAEVAVTPKEVQAARQRLAQLRASASHQPGFLVAEGLLAVREKQPAIAKQSFQRALAIDAKYRPAYMGLGGIYWAEHATNQADQALHRAAELAPVRSNERLRYAEFKLSTAGPAAGKKLLDALTKAAPDFVAAWQKLAELALAERHFSECKSDLDQILGREPSDYSALALKVQLYLAQGKKGGALGTAQTLVRAWPKLPLAYYQQGLAQLANQKLNPAVASLTQAIALDPKYASAGLLLAQLHIRNGNAAAAIPILTQLTNQPGAAVGADLALAEAYRANGSPQLALPIYDHLTQVMTNNVVPLYLKGVLVRQQGDAGTARTLFTRVLQRQPEYLPATAQLVEMDIAQKDYAAAHRRLRQRMAQEPKVAALPYIEAQVYLAQTQTNQAEGCLRQALHLKPTYWNAAMQLAQLYAASNQGQEALAQLQGVLAKDSTNQAALLQVGVIQNQLGHYDAAKDAYDKLLQLSATSVPALNNLAYLEAEHLGNVDRAFTLASKARQLAPQNPSVGDTLGWIRYRRGEYSWALSLLRESAAKLPGQPEIRFHLGMAYYMMGDEAAARSAFQQALKLAPHFSQADIVRQRLGILATPESPTNSAVIQRLESWAKAHPKDVVALSRLAAAAERKGEAAQAAQYYRQALKVNPQGAVFMTRLAEIEATALHQPQSALQLAHKAHDLAPNDAQLTRRLGRVAYDAGNYEWSLSLLQASAQEQSPSGQLLYDLACTEYCLGQTQDAISKMEQAVKSGLDRTRATAAQQFLTMARLVAKPDQIVASATAVRRVLQANPKELPARMANALILQHQGNAAAAQKAYQQILDQYPSFTPATRELALMLVATGKDDAQASNLAWKARAALPNDPELAKACGTLLERSGDWAGAVRLLKQASAQLTHDAGLLFQLGRAEHHLKQTADSRVALNRALALAPDSQWAPEARRLLAQP